MNKIFTLIFALVGFLSYSQNCKDVKTGTFVIENESYGGSLLIRKESSQEEIVEKLGIHTKYDLIWSDDCNYALFNRTIIKGNNKFPEVKKTDTLFVQITEITTDGYRFRASSNFSDFVTTGFVKSKK